MANAGTVTVDFAAEVAKFNAALKQVGERVKSVESSFKTLEKVASTALKFFSVGIATSFIKSAADAADALGKTADKLGISTERLTAFQLAAADAGVETATLNKLLVDAQRRLGDASFGTGEALKTLQSFGFNVRELQRLAPDELFLKYADAIGTLSNRSDQFSAAQALFGKSAQEAFTLIANGRPALEEAAAAVDRLGLALSRVDTFKIEQANDKLGLLAKVSQAFGQQLAAAIAPFVTEFVDRITGVGVAADDARSKFEGFARAAFVAFEITANAARSFDAAVSGVLFATFRSFEQMNEIVAQSLDLTARLDRAVGLDTIAKFFEDQAAAQRSLAGFAGAAADQAAARVEGALNSIKSFEQIFADIDRITSAAQRKAEQAAATQEAINEALRQPAAENTQLEAFNTNLLIQEDLQRLHHDRMLQQQAVFQEASAKLTQQLDVDTFIRQQTQREQAAIASEQRIYEARQRATNAGLNLLQAFAGKSKAVAIALVAINKARAVAEAIQNTSVAVTRTLASLPYPANVAAAASVKAFGALEVAAIVASGFGEIAQIRSNAGGGAPLGSPVNPIFTDAGSGSQAFGEPQKERGVIQIQVMGTVTRDAAIQIAEAIKDVVDNDDVRIFSKSSAQAQELRD